MPILNRASWILIGLIAVLVVTGGALIPLKKGFVEISQVNLWVLLLALLSVIQMKGSKAGAAELPLVRTFGAIERLSARLRRPGATTLGVLALFAVLAAVIHSFRLYQMDTGFEDHGIIQHVLASSWLRKPFQCDMCPNGTFLSVHQTYTLLLVAPLAGIFQKPELIFLLQGLLLAFGTFLLIRLGPLRQTPEVWLISALVLVCHSHFRYSWFHVDFREDHLAFFFLSLAALGAYRKSWALVATGSTLAALSKENIALVIPFLCLAAAWHWRGLEDPAKRAASRVFLGFLTAVSLAWIYFTFKILIPHFAGNSSSPHDIVNRFSGLGKTPAEVLGHLLTHPFQALGLLGGNLFDVRGLRYVFFLLVPWAFFLWKGRLWLVAAVPGLLMNLLSGKPEQRSLQWHYELILYPFLILAVLEGLRRSSRRELFIGLFLALAFSERWPGLELRTRWPSSERIQTVRWFYSIPKEGLLGAGFGHLGPAATRSELFLLRPPESAAEPVWKSFHDSNYRSLPDDSKEFWIDRAKWLLLNTTPAGSRLAQSAPEQGWVLRSQSPDQRHFLFERIDK